MKRGDLVTVQVERDALTLAKCALMAKIASESVPGRIMADEYEAAYHEIDKAMSQLGGCAACDRGDYQLGHHHDCPNKEGGRK